MLDEARDDGPDTSRPSRFFHFDGRALDRITVRLDDYLECDSFAAQGPDVHVGPRSPDRVALTPRRGAARLVAADAQALVGDPDRGFCRGGRCNREGRQREADGDGAPSVGHARKEDTSGARRQARLAGVSGAACDADPDRGACTRRAQPRGKAGQRDTGEKRPVRCLGHAAAAFARACCGRQVRGMGGTSGCGTGWPGRCIMRMSTPMTRTSQHPSSVSPTVGEAGDRPHRSNRWAGIAIVVVAVFLVAPTLLGSYRESKPPSPPRAEVLEQASMLDAVPVPPPVESASASCTDVEASGAHQFIELEETLIVGTADMGAPPLARPVGVDAVR